MVLAKQKMPMITIEYEREIITGWPHYLWRPSSTPNFTPVPRCLNLALTGEPPFHAWREELQDDLVHQLLRFRASQQWRLLIVAGRIGQEKFVNLAQKCPMSLIGLSIDHDLAETEVPIAAWKRIHPSDATNHTLATLAAVWARLPKHTRKAVVSLPRLTDDGIRCLANLPPKCLTSSLLFATVQSHALEIFTAVQAILELTAGDWRWGNVKDPDTLIELQWRLVPKSFGEPPIAGMVGIDPLRTGPEIRKEAHEMQHCLVSYAASIAAGNYFAYRVTHPGRATVVLQKVDETWQLHALVGFQNAQVADELREYVHTWLGDTELSKVEAPEF